ncbi:hypothetical protein Pelo_19388 [Pelomyxa schiedti]|nr:hypothetical protein Pelo_19388 [Pelomyxa schiedti]
MANCLCDVHQSHSSKIVKWLVTEYTRNISDPTVMTAKKNSGKMARLFAALIRLNKRGCLEWLFDRFHFTLPEVLVEVQAAKEHLGLKVDFATWKLLVRLFPEINRDDVTEHFMDVVTASPLHSQFSINRLGVTLDDIDQFCQESACENEDDELDDTSHWLDWTTCKHP